MGGSLNSLAPIFTPYPVDPDHPLNRGLRAWWLTIPDLYGGRQWFDLCDRNHFGLTNFTWANSYRPGGMGQLAANGVNSYGVLPGVTEFNWDFTQRFSVSLWATLGAAGDYNFIGNLDTNNSYRGWECSHQASDGLGLIFFLIDSWSGNAIQAVTHRLLNAGEPTHVLWTYDGSAQATGLTCYANGVPFPTDISVSANTLSATIANSVPLRIGSRMDGSSNLNGSMDDLRIYDRTLGPDEPAAWYRESLGGYAETLNRIMPRAVRPMPAVNPPWNADVMLSGTPFGGSLL